MPFNVESLGYVIEHGILRKPDQKFTRIDPNANEFEKSILNIFQNTADLSVASPQLSKYIHGWPSLYHLSSKRVDVLRPHADELKDKKVIEIGSSCGVITRYLGELNCSVLALEDSTPHAMITAERCRDLNNVIVVNDNLENFFIEEKFDFVIITDALESSNRTVGTLDILSILNKSKSLLSAEGKLLIAIENTIGLKYLVGAPAMNSILPYLELQNLSSQRESKTFDYDEIASLLNKAGLDISECLYPFPDYKFADVVVTHAGFRSKDFDALELLFEKFEYIQNLQYEGQFSSTLTAVALHRNNLLPRTSNSFLITATVGPVTKKHTRDRALAYVYSSSRKKGFCKQTVFTQTESSGHISVIRQSLYPDQSNALPLLHQVLQNESYIRGSILLNSLLPVVSVPGWGLTDLINWAGTYFKAVISKSFQEDQQDWLIGEYVDLAPFNVIVADGQLKFFDLEWVCHEKVPAHYVFFRGLAHSLARVLFVSNPSPETPLQIVDLASRVTSHYFKFAAAELADCKRLETEYFSAVGLTETTEPFSTRKLNVRKRQYVEISTELEKRNSEYLKALEVNKELSLKNKKLSNKLAKQQKELDTQVSLTKESKKRQSELFHEVVALKKDNKWYIDTYRNRSLPGIIIQKISETVTSLLKRLRPSNSYSLVPGNHVVFTRETEQYTIKGPESCFLVDLEGNYLKPGWYWLTLETKPGSGELVSPKLYLNPGSQFNERNICFLATQSQNGISTLVNFYTEVRELRLDPSISGCQFVPGNFSLRRLSKFGALQKTFRLFKKASPAQSNWSITKDLFSTYRKHGTAGVRDRLRKMSQAHVTKITPYIQWCNRYDTITEFESELLQKISKTFGHQPLFSIIMPVYNPPLIYLQKAISSVLNQAYPNWELCIADDCSTNKEVKKLLTEYQQTDKRIKVVYRQSNGHISEASNSALQIARGEFVVLLDQDDQLSPHALFMVAEAINRDHDAALLYSDEDKIDEDGNRFDPYFKTDWNPDLFLGQNMISHLGVYKTSIVKEIGGFRKGFEGSQDYDLALRFIQRIKESQIVHIPHVLYHWRAIPGSTALKMDNKDYAFTSAIKALQSFVRDQNLNATVLPNANNSSRIKWNLTSTPLVSIIIPTKDKAEVLSRCINSILQKTNYTNYEIIIVDNNSLEEETERLYADLLTGELNLSIVPYNDDFNFSAIVNYGVSKSKGEVLVLLNNDTEVINEGWLEELVSQALRKDVGAVGAKLLYPNGRIQHAGVFLYDEHPGIHIYQQKDKDDPGYVNKLNLVQNYSAVTAACLAVRKELFQLVNGLDEENLPVAYNDIDFCLKLLQKGYRNVWTPFSMLYHHEFLSRGDDFSDVNIERFTMEQAYMLGKWKKFICKDPYFNPNLSPATRTTAYAFPPKVSFSWRTKDFSKSTWNRDVVGYESELSK